MINGKNMPRIGAVKSHVNHRFVMSDPVDEVICLDRVSLVSKKLKIDLILSTRSLHRTCVETSAETTEKSKTKALFQIENLRDNVIT